MKKIKIKMFRVIGIITSLHLLVACNSNSTEAVETPQDPVEDLWLEVSNSTDHWEYLIFLNLHPESDHFDTALARFFYYQNRYFDEHGVPPWHPKNNGFTISLLEGDSLLGDAELFSRDSLQHIAYNFLLKSGSSHDFPDLMPFMDFRGQEREISKGVFLVWVDSMDRAQPIIVELKTAWDRYKDYLSQYWYNKLSVIDSDKLREDLDSAFMRRVYFYEGQKRLVPPPPPPPNE